MHQFCFIDKVASDTIQIVEGQSAHLQEELILCQATFVAPPSCFKDVTFRACSFVVLLSTACTAWDKAPIEAKFFEQAGAAGQRTECMNIYL
jgi:hypothetical protein